MQFQEQSTTRQLAVLQQVWKRLKIAEWQAIAQIADLAAISFDDTELLLHKQANLPGFMETMRREGRLDEEVLDISQYDMARQVLLLTENGFAWGEMDEDPVSSVLEML